jgi:hypothetical protein
MEKLVQQLPKKIDRESELFTLDACRRDGMNAEEAELADGRGRALAGHRLRRPIARLRQRNNAAGGDPQTACASLGAEAARKTECR